MDARNAGGGVPDGRLLQAHQALDAGDAQRAAALAREVLHAAQTEGDLLAEAQALACLAHCDRQVSRLRRAHDGSQRAAHLFRHLGDTAAEAMALSTHAHTAASLGRSEEAVEAALLSVRLSETLPAGAHRALAQNYLGTAYFWGRHYAQASAAFEAAAALARAAEPPLSPLQPLANLLYLEALRLANERFHGGQLPATDGLRERMRACEEAAAQAGFDGLLPGIQVTCHAMHHLMAALCLAWNRAWTAADEQLRQGLEWSQRYQTPTWLLAVQCWVRAELSWARGDWADAEQQLAAMVVQAAAVEHEQLACLGHLLAASLFEARGKRAEALAELRSLRRREEQIRIESLDSRARVVGWQLDVRAAERSLRSLEAESQLLHKLSMEDPLTGLANRRCLEARLAEALRGATGEGQPLSLAVLDVDRFKQINDGYSHQLGDQVLKRLAAILRDSVREHDLPARWAGDEFVVLFQRTPQAQSAQVCERIAAAVRAIHWEGLAEGLRVSVSLGVAEAQPGDDVATLLHRGDVQMYRAKGTARASTPA